jgi:hypothetical protein
MSGLIAGGMLSGLGQGIAQFGATMSALERERERLEEARALKREELAARMADRAMERDSKMSQKEMEVEGRLANTQAAGAAAKATAEATYGTQPSEDQVIRRLMLENGWSREEAAQAYRADPVMVSAGADMENPPTSAFDRKGSIERGGKVIKAEQDQLRFNRPGYSDQFAKSEEGMQGVRLREEMLNGTRNPGKVADATLSTKTGERFSMNNGSVLKKSTGDTATTEVGEAEAAKDRATRDGSEKYKGIRDQINLVDSQRKSADTRIRELIDLQKSEAANVYGQDEKKAVIERYNKQIATEQKRREQLDALFGKLNDQLFSGGSSPGAPAARTGGTLPPTAEGVSNAVQQFHQMKGR